MRRWTRRARALGDSLLEVLHAEVQALLSDFQRTGRGAVRGLALFLVAAALVFWSVGLLITFAVALVATWVGVWQAAGLVFLAVALAGFGVAAWGMAVFKKLDGPTQIVRTHVDDHVAWWRQTLAERRGEVGPPPTDGGEDSK